MKVLLVTFTAFLIVSSLAACSRAQPVTAAAAQTSTSPAMPEGLAPDGQCPAVPDSPADGAAPIIPLTVGLTLSSVWKVDAADPDRECLTQVKAMDAVSITVTNTCPSTRDRRLFTMTRRICRADLREAYMYHCSTNSKNPEVIGGTTMFSVSSRALRELRTAGKTRHRYVRLFAYWRDEPKALDTDREGMLADVREATMPVIVNDRVVDLPVLKASGMMGDQPMQATILKDERLPLMLDYHWDIGFDIRYTKISFPGNAMERALDTQKRVDVYGIYFDFAQDEPRPESEPVLREIAQLLKAHPDWTLAINGHTDNVGGDASNLSLSRRRSDAVRRALVERFGIAASRLTGAGFGASQPKATNDTIEGRAKNRRVELVRQ